MDIPGEDLDEALGSAWSDVDSGDAPRVESGIVAFRALLPRVIVAQGEAGSAHRSALRGVAHGLGELGRVDDARAMLHALADVCRTALDSGGHLGEHRMELIEDRLYADAAEALIGQDPDAASPETIDRLDALVAEGERTLGGANPRVLWLMERRAQWLTRLRVEDGLRAYDLLIARAAAVEEGGVNHLMTLASKAQELSRLDEDAESALLWERVLEGRRTLLGLEHPDTLDAWWWRARTRYWSQDLAGADADLTLLIPAMQRTFGDDAPSALEAMRLRAIVLRRLRDEGVPADDPLPLLRRVSVLESARFGPGSRQVLNTRLMAVEVQLAAADREASLSRLADEVRAIADEAETEQGASSRVSLQSRELEARVLRQAASADGDLASQERGRSRARLRCELVERACEAWRDGDLSPEEEGLGAARLFDEFRQAWTDLSLWEEAGSVASLDVLSDAAERLTRFGAPARMARISLYDDLGRTASDAGDGERSLAAFERSLELEQEIAAEATTPGDRLTGAVRIAQSRQAVAVALRGLGRTIDAAALLESAISEAERESVHPPVVDDLRNARALALQELGRFDEATRGMRALYEASGDVRHAIDLAAVYLNGDRPAEAEALLRPVLQRLRDEGSGDTVQAMRVLGNLANAACQLDRHAEAAAGYDRLHEMQLAALGPRHRDALITLNNRALEERHLGNHAEAVRRFERVLALRTEALGDRDPHTLTTLSNLAGAVGVLGDRARARELLERAVVLSREVLGPTHPSTLGRIRDLDAALARDGVGEEARQELAEETRASFAAPDPSGSPALSSLAYADHLTEQGRYGDAVIEYGRARDLLADHPDVEWLRAERGIAECYRRLGAHREAADACTRIVPQLERLLPDDRWALADALNDLSLSFSHSDRVEEMATTQRRAIRIADTAEPDPERTVKLRIWLGRRLAEHGRQEEALEAYTDARDAGESRLSPQHALTLDAADDIAETFAALGRHREALRIYRRNIPVMERVLGKDSPQVKRARSWQKKSSEQAGRTTQIVIGGTIALVVIALVVWNLIG